MSLEVDELIAVGHAIGAEKYCIISACTILFYDYFLTFEDEVKYAWSGKKTWAFWLFLVNRYFPISYQIWSLATSYTPHYSTAVCNRIEFYPIFAFTVCTLLAQVVLTARIYAVTMKNIPITIGFAIITASQLALGVYMVAIAAMEGAQPLPPIPLDPYRLCGFVRHRNVELAYPAISILYDTLALSLIVFSAVRLKTPFMPGAEVRTILGTITADAVRYFLAIFSAHFVLMMTLTLAPEWAQLIPGPGLPVVIPVMISRIMFSLKRAADSQRKGWSLVQPTVAETTVEFPRFWRSTTERRDDVTLETHMESQIATR